MTTITARTWGQHRTYYVDGLKVPGASTLAGMVPKDITGWYAQQCAEYATANWESLGQLGLLDRVKAIQGAAKQAVTAAANRGTACHAAMEALANGQPATTDDPSVLADAEAAVQLMDAWKIQPVATETGLANLVEMYAGTADLVAASEPLDGQFLMDYKFGKSSYPSHAIQLSAYAHADHAIVEIPQSGPRGGKLKPLYELGDAPAMDQSVAYVIHARDGVANLLPVQIDGWIWEAVQIAADMYWRWETRTGWNFRDSDSFTDPIGKAMAAAITITAGDDIAPF